MNPPEKWNQPEEWNQPGETPPPDPSFAELERHLTAALGSLDPPDGFADRVLARARSAPPARAKRLNMTLSPRPWVAGTIAACLLTGVFFAEHTHLRHQRQKAERAEQQFEAAMRITDQTLEHVRRQLQQAGISIGN